MLSVEMRFTAGGDAEHYTVGANAAFLLLLVHVLPFTILLGSMLAFFFSLSMFNYCPLQSTLIRGDTALFSFKYCLWGSARLMRYLWGQTAFLFGCRRTHLFYSWCWYYTTHGGAVEIAVTLLAILLQSALL